MNFNIIICGVGGQGIVLASRLIAITAMNKGYTVSTAETLGRITSYNVCYTKLLRIKINFI